MASEVQTITVTIPLPDGQGRRNISELTLWYEGEQGDEHSLAAYDAIRAAMKEQALASRSHIHVTTSEEVVLMLRLLVHTGLYGKSVEEAAERVLCQALEGKTALLKYWYGDKPPPTSPAQE